MATGRKTKKTITPARKAAPRRTTAAAKRGAAPRRAATVGRRTAPVKAQAPAGAQPPAVAGKPAAPGTNGKHPASPVTPVPLPNQTEQLLKERAQTENELTILRAELQVAPEMTGDEVDLNVYERERTLGLVASYERRLEEINAALQAAEQGKYGICERCGKPIDPERLKIFPEARLCISCKSQVEREQRRARL